MYYDTKFTKTEFKVLARLLLEDQTREDIAKHLRITRSTLRGHIRNIKQKLKDL